MRIISKIGFNFVVVLVSATTCPRKINYGEGMSCTGTLIAKGIELSSKLGLPSVERNYGPLLTISQNFQLRIRVYFSLFAFVDL